MKAWIIAVALGLLIVPLSVRACEKDSLPIRYLQSVQDMDWDGMASLLAESARYHDPTMIYFDRDAISLESPGRIVDFWRSASEESGTSGIDYTITSCFETAGYWVIDYDIDITVSGAFWNVARETIHIPGQVTSVIRVEDGFITEHTDYVDYAGSERFINQLREAVGPAAN